MLYFYIFYNELKLIDKDLALAKWILNWQLKKEA